MVLELLFFLIRYNILIKNQINGIAICTEINLIHLKYCYYYLY